MTIAALVSVNRDPEGRLGRTTRGSTGRLGPYAGRERLDTAWRLLLRFEQI